MLAAWAMQQSACQPQRAPFQVGASVQCKRPGKACASRLPAPPLNTNCAEPCHTVPRALSHCTWPWLAWFTPQASQRAGAHTAKAKPMPRRIPHTACRQSARVPSAVAWRRPSGGEGRGRMGMVFRAGAAPKCLATALRWAKGCWPVAFVLGGARFGHAHALGSASGPWPRPGPLRHAK